MVPDYCEAILETKDISSVEERLNKFTMEKLSIDIGKGWRKYKNNCRGISAHGSTPEKGKCN